MDLKVIIIIGLLVISYMQYSMPDKVKGVTDPTWGKLQNFIDSKNPISNTPQPEGDGCPITYNPVCGNGVTYDNICKAALADVLEVTQGAC